MQPIRLALAVFLAVASLLGPRAEAQSLAVVAAENFYGDVVRQLGGANVAVTSILNNPDQDPHLFEASISTARALAAAKLVVYNGIGYDPWMDALLAAHKAPDRKVVVVASLLQRKAGDNPHLWYDPATMPMLASAVSTALIAADPAHRADYEQRRDQFVASLTPLADKIASLRRRYGNSVVAATEPVFGYMADALGFTMRHRAFQIAVMNDTEPSAGEIASFEKDLKTRAVKILFYNNQTSGDLTARLQTLAQASHVPIVGITETEPPNITYQDWMMRQLGEVEHALADGPA
jgi:zinc/manganese transport system substrate-binding protein